MKKGAGSRRLAHGEIRKAGRPKIKGRPRSAGADPSALLPLAMAHLQNERWADAGEICGQLLAMAPRNPELLNLAGVVAQKRGEYTGATGFFNQAMTVVPGNPQFVYNYGEACRMAGRFVEAESAFRKAASIAPEIPDIHFNLGNTLASLSRHEEALPCFQHAIRLNPKDADYHLGLGETLAALDRHAEALAAFDRALADRPEFVEALVNRGGALNKLGRGEEAVACLRRALEIDPDDIGAHMKLGGCLHYLGQFDEAAACFEWVLREEPTNAKALYSLSFLEKWSTQPENLSKIEQALAADGNEIQDRIDLAFAAGMIHENAGRYDTAFETYKFANDLSYRQERWDRRVFNWLVKSQIEIFTPALFESKRSYGNKSEIPVFIVGMPRSGTTLVEQILASHPVAYGAGELMAISDLTTKTLCSDPYEKNPYPQAVVDLTAEALAEFARTHLSDLRKLAPEAERISDKMPGNFRHLGLIALMFPNARIIHCRRDPMDTCFSCFTQNFAAGHQFTHKFSDLGHYYRGYQRLMEHWRQVLPVHILEVDYETLVADQEAESRRIVDYCGLDWDENCLAFHKTERPVATASFTQVRRPMYSSSVGRWCRFEDRLDPLKEALGI